MDIASLNRDLKEIKKLALHMVHRSNASHIGGCFSSTHILTYLYSEYLKNDPKKPDDPARDRFILSKGHAAAALYATLAYRGYFPLDWLSAYCCKDAKLSGHATHTNTPGVEVSSGSLGHGLPLASGMAFSLKDSSSRVVTLLSDGECQEGSTWEAFALAGKLELSNLVAVIDYNKIQAYGQTDEILPLGDIEQRIRLLGWDTIQINGHDFEEIDSAFNKISFCQKPKCIIAHTIKGQGVSYMENNLAWHYKSPNAEQLNSALIEIENKNA